MIHEHPLVSPLTASPARSALVSAMLLLTMSLAGCGPAQDAEAGAATASERRSSASVSANTLTEAERAEGWQLLFDGRTLSGWRGLGRDSVHSAHWVVDGDAIRKVGAGAVPSGADGEPLPGGDLMTEETFRDFEFAFEWKVSPGANSGVKYNVSEAYSLEHSRHSALGFEYQVLDDDLHPEGVSDSHRAGDLYELLGANDRKSLRPAGEWNEGRIVFVGTRGEHWLNGEKIVEFELGTPRMNSAFANSKWSHMPEFIERREAGHIVLQDHRDDVWFRNLRIRELGSSPR